MMFLEKDRKEKIKKELYEYIDNKCIFRCNPDIQYFKNEKNGVIIIDSTINKTSNYNFYLRNLTCNPIMLTHISVLFLDDLISKMKNNFEKNYFQLCGLENNSIPILTAIQLSALKLNLNINCFTIKKERNSEGLYNIVDGIPTSAPVIFVDDLLDSGSSAAKCFDICEYDLGLKPANNMYCIIKTKKHMEQLKFKNNIINVNNIFDLSEFDTKYDPKKYWFPEDCD